MTIQDENKQGIRCSDLALDGQILEIQCHELSLKDSKKSSAKLYGNLASMQLTTYQNLDSYACFYPYGMYGHSLSTLTQSALAGASKVWS